MQCDGGGAGGRWRVYNSRNIRNETTAQWSLYINILNKCRNAICVCFCFHGCLSFCPSFLVVNTNWDLIIIQRSSFHLTFSKQTVAHFLFGLDIKRLFFCCCCCCFRKPEIPPCHLELDVGHICSYGYLFVWACECVCECEWVCMCEGKEPLYVAFYVWKWKKKGLTRVDYSGAARKREKKKKVYI